ncbi:hypothetical protein XI00_13580 [Bradyrhizobium sp. CCBAU 21359]|nr:hypothetical protein [Bradyrhizobium sp. CCBAU 21359]
MGKRMFATMKNGYGLARTLKRMIQENALLEHHETYIDGSEARRAFDHEADLQVPSGLRLSHTVMSELIHSVDRSDQENQFYRLQGRHIDP